MTDSVDFTRLFNPRSIAVIGVSNDITKGAMVFVTSLIKMGFAGSIFPIHPKHDEILGLKTYARVRDIPYPVDYAIIGVPAPAVPGALEDCIEKGVPCAQIFTSGFEEAGTQEGSNLQKVIVNMTKDRIRIIGPNCMGIYHPKAKIGFEDEQPIEPGYFSFISQSGGLAMNLVDRSASEKIPINKLVSVGNSCDLRMSDFLAYFSKESETKVIGMYLEGLQKGEHRKFLKIVKEMTSTKLVVMWKSGYTDAGARAARSHTGSMVGTYDLWRSIASQVGIILVNNMDELVDVISLYVRAPLPQGKNIGIVAYGGGTSVTATDACTEQGLKLPLLEKEIQNKILDYIPEAGTFRSNPVDVTGWVTSPRISKNVSGLVGNDPNINALIFILEIDFVYKQCHRLNLDMDRLIGGHSKFLLEIKEKLGKPVVCVLQKIKDSIGLETVRLKIKENLNEAGIPNFPSIDRAAKAISRVNGYSTYLRRL
jgi:acyl-CoA synthetase (NDP forming)